MMDLTSYYLYTNNVHKFPKQFFQNSLIVKIVNVIYENSMAASSMK